MSRLALPGGKLLLAQFGVDPLHWLDEVIDHAVGFGVIDVPSIKFAVGDDINSSKLLNLQNGQNRISQTLTRAEYSQPRGNRVAANNGRFDHDPNPATR